MLKCKNKYNIFCGFYQKPFWVHLIWGILFIVFFIMIIYYSIDFFTYHNAYFKVPKVVNLVKEKAFEVIKQNQLTPIISDSLFFTKYPPNTIIKQIPQSGSWVKKKRNIYLVVNKTVPPLIDMPQIIGLKLDVALSILKSIGLSVKDTLYKDDLGKNLVLEAHMNNKKLLFPSKLPLGSQLTIVIGNGLTPKEQELVWIPDLIGKNLSETYILAKKYKLKLVLYGQEKYTLPPSKLFVELQKPYRYDNDHRVNKVPSGSALEIWLTDRTPL